MDETEKTTSTTKTTAPKKTATTAKTGTAKKPATAAKTSTAKKPATAAKTSTAKKPATTAKTSTAKKPATTAKTGAAKKTATTAKTGTAKKTATTAKTSAAEEPASMAEPTVEEQVAAQTPELEQPVVTDMQVGETENATSASESSIPEETSAPEIHSEETSEAAAAQEDVATKQDDIKETAAVADGKSDKQEKDKKPLSKRNRMIIISVIAAIAVIAVLVVVLVLFVGNAGKNKATYTVTFDSRGGSEIASYKLNEGDKIKRPEDPTNIDMFKFVGWYWENPNEPGKVQEFVFDTPIYQNITLFAKWEGEISVRVVYDCNGGTFESEYVAESYGLPGMPIDQPIDPTRDGYLFNGWYEDRDCVSEFSFSGYPIEDAILYAGWAKDPQYAYISYYGNGELLKTDFVKKNDDVVIPELFSDDSIVVGDWYIDADYKTSYTPGKATEDMSLYMAYYTVGLEFDGNLVSGYNGTETVVYVPQVYNGVTITGIGSYAFYRTSELQGITSVILPETITRINEGAFYNCQYLVNINLTDKLTYIGANAFYRNMRLKTCGDISNVTSIGDSAFNGCYVLNNLELPASITKIGDYAFHDCRAFTEIAITSPMLVTIGEYAFSDCTSLVSVVIESTVVQTIGDYAFENCEALQSVTIKNVYSAAKFGGEGNQFKNCRNVTIYVTESLLETYKNDPSNIGFKDKFAAIR